MDDYDAEGARSSLGDDPLGTGKNWACPKDDASTSLFVGEMDAYTCPVCYAELFIKHEHETSCEHRFCKKCFKKLCIANASLLGVPCPLCRKLQPWSASACEKKAKTALITMTSVVCANRAADDRRNATIHAFRAAERRRRRQEETVRTARGECKDRSQGGVGEARRGTQLFAPHDASRG